MKCFRCGKEVPNDSLFCQYCGNEIPEVKRCSHCNAELSGDMQFCAMCGIRINSGGNSDVSTSAKREKKLSRWLVVASVVAVISIVCSCVFGYLYRKNYNIAIHNYEVVESLKEEISRLQNDVSD